MVQYMCLHFTALVGLCLYGHLFHVEQHEIDYEKMNSGPDMICFFYHLFSLLLFFGPAASCHFFSNHHFLRSLFKDWPLMKHYGPSQVRSQCPFDLFLLNSKLWCIKAQRTTNGWACIKHLPCFLIKEPFTTGR